METYIDRIKMLKSQKKITNEKLAELSGIPLGTLSKILAGMSDSPKLNNITAICDALDCSLEYVVSGTPENTNNYTLDMREIRLVENYRRLDDWGKGLVDTVAVKAGERTETEAAAPAVAEKNGRVLPVLRTGSRYTEERRARSGKRPIKLYELPVSAGVGVYLEEETALQINIPNNDKTAEADYALRISGSSMEPKYQNGDILLVQHAEGVEVGELGIFLLDGSGFFKVFGGDRLISLNSAYGPILLKEFSDVQCKGRVIGKLKRK